MGGRAFVLLGVAAVALAACGHRSGDVAQAPGSLDIAFSFAGRIHAMRPDGSGRLRLTDERGVSDGEPAWSRDGARLAFVRAVGVGEVASRSRILVLEPGGGRARPLTAADGASVSGPAWSLDGRQIAFRRSVPGDESQIVVAEVDGGGERVLWREPPDGAVGEPAWSPDGARIAYTRTVLDSSFHFRPSLYAIAAVGGEPRLLARDAGDAAWSPDGARIAFSSTRDRNGEWCGSDQCSYNGELYVMDADGTDPLRLTRSRGDDRSPSWSPDGRRIAFASNRNNRHDPPGLGTEIYSIGADGACLTWLTNGAPQSLDPAWRNAPGGSSDPGGCGATRRPPRTEVYSAGRANGPGFWLGERYRNLLLDYAEVGRNARSRRSFLFTYGDCASFHLRDCPLELNLQSTSVCSRLSPLRGFNQPLPDRLRRSFAARGLLLVRLSRAGVSVIAGGASVKIVAQVGPGPVRLQLLAAGRAIRPIGRPAARLRTPALPRALLEKLNRTERAVRRLGSADAARALGVSTPWVRRRLLLARAVDSLLRVRAVPCSRR